MDHDERHVDYDRPSTEYLQNKKCKPRPDSEFENSRNQVLETKPPFYLLECSLSACPVSVPGHFLSTCIPWALRTAGHGAQRI